MVAAGDGDEPVPRKPVPTGPDSGDPVPAMGGTGTPEARGDVVLGV